ncbi:hypothetical protein [Amycolatopsis sp. NPDC059021]|uniref:hypothetical protein n=1 Tax=Amycolatopsis sp. NPDC059021 TaxID=3346704 RepID=UPI0036725B31
MSSDFQLDPEQLHHARKEIQSSAEEAVESWQDAVHRISGHWGCWSDDSYGKSFAKKWVPQYQKFYQDAKPLFDWLETLSGSVGSVDRNLSEVDENNAARVRRQAP